MGNEKLKAVAGSELVAQQNDPATFPGMLKAWRGELERALPRHMNADRMCRIALTCFRTTPLLASCTPTSIFGAIVQASQWGLEPGLAGRAYLVPYKNHDSGKYECQLIPGWKGLVDLVNRTGRATVWTGAVFVGDEFGWELGDSPRVWHKPGDEDDPAKLTHTYAVGRIKGNDWPVIEAWTIGKVIRHRDRYNKVGKKHYSFDNLEMYARKVPLLQVIKYLPSSPELERAIDLSDRADVGASQGLTFEGALADAPPPPPPKDEAQGKAPAPKGPPPPPEVTYASVAHSLGLAEAEKNAEMLAIARDLIRIVPDERQRAELDVEAKRIAKVIEGKDAMEKR